ncbi:MAG TPA: hypothetical protein VNL14_16415 [Candidatus Acidoferrales bacterium]|nr:hypothetical protein [Candidatus Acidoferrales bacterium]
MSDPLERIAAEIRKIIPGAAYVVLVGRHNENEPVEIHIDLITNCDPADVAQLLSQAGHKVSVLGVGRIGHA